MSFYAPSYPLARDTVDTKAPGTGKHIWQILAGAVGNVLEWYDFAAYGYFASALAKNFFPSENAALSLASTFGVFAAAFLMRPIGGALFGHVGDRFGRKQALLTSAGLMTLATFAMGLLPNYAVVGAAAPLLLIGFRLLQGLSIGGEFTASAVFLVERSDPRHRGLTGSFASVSATVGLLLGSGIGVIATWVLTPAQVDAWGWRIPFLLGILLGAFALFLRRIIVDDEPRHEAEQRRLPVVEALATDWPDILRGAVMGAAFAAGFYLIFVYVVTMVEQIDDMPAHPALEINTLSMLVLVAATPCFGALSDRLGRKPVLLASLAGLVLFSWPLFKLLLSPSFLTVLLGQSMFALIAAAWFGTIQAALVEMFRSRTRCTALSISYNVAYAVFGGTAPIIAIYLVNRLHADFGPAFFLMVIGAISFVAVLTMPDRTGQPLR
ncbi:MFS transporter [Bradyrhizobium canariense]|uniref:MFS transporter, MHS family, proline/betaine transporter n=1 Tax=Bradyrhizobium canariense TaxID=255045 RepID=A0A1H1WNX9_9BRAD|nr:MFS transporter [Bradyrhizobium canariense]SDS98833.1 MFS transporter, MHS family, proline/betaine transporter [Bradyrhizobium canariense]